MAIGFYSHDLFLKHLEGYEHVERPERLRAILQQVKKSPIVDKLVFINAEPAEQSVIELVHDPHYVNQILTLKTESAVILDWGDTVATPLTPQAALFAAGAGIQAARDILAKKFSSAFCAVRPPGHHAETARAMGFCLFNNVAIAAAYLLEKQALNRVAIVDWDVHHGNGTEHTYIESDRLLYVSLHQYPHYPGTGSSDVVGTGNGRGYTLNIPLAAGTDDTILLDLFDNKVIPALDRFAPEFILISAGFDGHVDDPLSGTCFSTDAYGEMTRRIRISAERHCDGRIVSFLEGGYDLVALAESVEKHLSELIG